MMTNRRKSIHGVMIHLIIVPLLLTGCRITAFTEPLDFSLDLLDIEEVIVPENISVDQTFIITITGHLPDSSWSFDHFELTLRDLSLTVKPVGIQDLDHQATFAESRIPFERDLSYSAKESGTWIVIVIGRNKTIETEVSITGTT